MDKTHMHTLTTFATLSSSLFAILVVDAMCRVAPVPPPRTA
jgi:hypothetical protein